jgi:hypothetical protein
MIHSPNPAQLDENRVDWARNSNGMVKALVVVGDYRVTLTERRFSNASAQDRREFYQTTRVYGAIDALVPEFAAEEPYQGISIPFAPEEPIDKMRSSVWRAWKNATTAEAAKRLAKVLTHLSKYDGVTVGGDSIQSIKFSQKAGCTMCPCTPGFVLGGTVRSDRDGFTGYGRSNPVDIWIEVV